ncbi:hypothetical protein F511_01878 [Dorcoceras hygrometricum]|uniref:Uncharacterized protein n=1 Tax=Dorcoceras hygrometricum TaxID=472368 RepID=A0A2Z7D1Q7_9LAMI|nr:hypothetical protein F511_01878 [Dorcoceras hygrometricum]
MEHRQLNFDAPLISVRRFSSPIRSSDQRVENTQPHRQKSLPLTKSEFEMEEVTKPASVPFQWEKIPGKSKGGVYTPEEPCITPSLPPAMVSDAIRRNSGEIPRMAPGRISGPLRYNSGEIPRVIPGRVSSSSRYNSVERSSDQNIYRTQMETLPFMDHASLLEKLNESLDCKDESDTGSENEECSDGLYSHSRTESSSFNYSVSGLSGNHSSCGKPSGTFSVDVQTRDFMMNRFLPAAKAVVLETPQYVVKKPLVVNEPPKEQIKKVISCQNKPLPKQYGFDSMQQRSEYTDYVESEDEQQSPVPVKKRGKIWGIIPRLCVKNTLCLFSPLPGIKPRSQTPSFSSGEIRRPAQKAYSGPLYKNSCHPTPQKKFHSGLLSRDLQEIEKKLAGDSNQILNSLGSYKSGLSPLRRNRSGVISPYRNESTKPPHHEGAGFVGLPKEVGNESAMKIASSRKMLLALQDVSRNQINGTLKPDGAIDGVKDIKMDQLSTKKCRPPLEPDVNFGAKDENGVESDDQREFVPACMKSPLPPPLPKSPSESWLWRTLPSTPLGNSFLPPRSKSPFGSKKQAQQGSMTDTKWETIVKSSYSRHDHVRYSAELVPFGSHMKCHS